MRKVLKRIAVAMLCLAVCSPIMIAKADFTPSVSYKPAPEIVPQTGKDGRSIIGRIVDEDGNVLMEVGWYDLVLTPIAEVDTSTQIPDKAADELKKVYNDIVRGKTRFSSYRKLNELVQKALGAGKTGDDLEVLDIFDISEVGSDVQKYLEQKGTTIDIIFDLDIPADQFIAAMVYKNGDWDVVPKIVNNGDGTVTVTFDHFSPIAFLVPGTGVPGNIVPETGDPNEMKDITLWLALAGVSLVAIIGVGVYYRRRSR